MMSPILVEHRGSSALITINNAPRMNALSRAVVAGLLDALDALHDAIEIRTVVITGAGGRAFCAGADLKERGTMTDTEVRQFLRDLKLVLARIEGLPKPVIAAINGFAFGGGLELALACDLRIASESAKMGLTEVRLGIIPGAGGTQRLPRLIGVPRAKELIYTGRRLTAVAAEQYGIVGAVHPPDALLDAAFALADEMAQAGPLALKQAKFAIQEGMNVDLATGLMLEQKAYEVLLPSEDRLEALAAFHERRAPVFKGK